MLTPNNAVDYSNPSGFDCGTPDQQAAFLTYHRISKEQFDAVVAWFNGPNTIPAAYTKSKSDIISLISGANCNVDAVVLMGDITKLGQTDLEISLMTYDDINSSTSSELLAFIGLDLFAGLIAEKNADAFHFYKGTYTYTTNPGVKMSCIVFVATANGAPVYYADYIPN